MRNRLSLFLSLGFYAIGIDAQESQQPTETIVITGTRTERAINLVPATLSVTTTEDIEREITRDIRDLIRYEPGISVGGTGDRFGLGSFTIRGIGGNRVLTMIDGVRVADAYSFGPFLSANRDYVDIDELESVEIMRGPGSALYGSDALGGVVAYRTKDAADYLHGERFYGGVKAGYSDVDDGSATTLTLATGADNLSGMLLYTHRDAHETENYGDGAGGTGPTRALPDPLDLRSDSALLKLSVHASERHQVAISLDSLDSRTESQVLSDYGLVVGTTRTDVHDADDSIDRQRASIDYAFLNDGGVFDRVGAQVYWQDSEQVQKTRQERTSLTTGLRTNRWRDSSFDQDIAGLSVQADKHFEPGSSDHYLIVGGDFWTTDSSSLRDGGTTNAPTGAVVPESPVSPLPTRDFPPTTVDQSGIFVQDEITLLGDRLRLTPSVRFDSYDATARGDSIYFAGNPGQPAPADFSDSEVSPKLGLLYGLTERFALYAQYAEGFKAPPYDDVNVGFTNPIGGYKTISNPDLTSERSRNAELGLRVNAGFGRLALVAFRNEYDDFIESLLIAPQFAATGGVDPADGLLTFQSQNIEGVTIDGVELSGSAALGRDSPWSLEFALATADGSSDADSAPLDSIDPPKAVFGLRYSSRSGRWGGDLVWTVVDDKDVEDISGNRLATPGYGLVDVLGYVQFAQHVRLNVGLFNVGDQRYIEWADTAAIAFSTATGTYPEEARFTHPGFNAGVNLRVEF
jgi:hemoglobin/transferrin/lactoferrin receptor protein